MKKRLININERNNEEMKMKSNEIKI